MLGLQITSVSLKQDVGVGVGACPVNMGGNISAKHRKRCEYNGRLRRNSLDGTNGCMGHMFACGGYVEDMGIGSTLGGTLKGTLEGPDEPWWYFGGY